MFHNASEAFDLDLTKINYNALWQPRTSENPRLASEGVNERESNKVRK